MIKPTSSSDRPRATEAVTLSPPGAEATVQLGDRFSDSNSAVLRAALANQPEIRADVVAKGRALAVDPSYPSADVLRKVGQAILASPDLSEAES